MKKQILGFTLIELLVAVSVFSIGMVGVGRSFLGAASALDYAQNKMAATRHLEDKINTLIEDSRGNSGVKEGQTKEQARLASRQADFTLKITAIEEEELKNDIALARASLIWQEGGIEKSAGVSVYLPLKKKGHSYLN